jgi:glutamyl/glutaminyl-tRNA synthetase
MVAGKTNSTFLKSPVKNAAPNSYRGRIAPTPTGRLHEGHAKTFWTARERVVAAEGRLILRIEDLDLPRCKPEFVEGCIEDLIWFGFDWHEGPDKVGQHAPYYQSKRTDIYRSTLEALIEKGHVYRCHCSRKDIEQAARAPHAAEDELIYPGTCRSKHDQKKKTSSRNQYCWRFKVPKGISICFQDGRLGMCEFKAEKHFGDFVVWRADSIPSYQLAVTVDDHLMNISEVVRGEDLIISTARQLLLYEALEWEPPSFYHCPLVLDEKGQRLAKRHQSLSLRALRESEKTPEQIRAGWNK